MPLWNEEGLNARDIRMGRPIGVVLDPLAEVEVGMMVPVMVRRRQLMMHAQRDAEGRHHQHGYEGRKGG